MEQRENIDNIISYIFIKKLVTPIVKSSAYKMGLVNNAGSVVRKPRNAKERNALTVLDKLIFKLKRLLGGKLTNLNTFLYLTSLSNDFYRKLMVRGSVVNRAELIKIRNDIDKLLEK